ncbi:unnamed protein product [Linum trigynum]|uniref:Uncharacterized protein n=1 Tax=Linum trigynum TaxID=586398 RepID=A0AAV2G945_9ROSI
MPARNLSLVGESQQNPAQPDAIAGKHLPPISSSSHDPKGEHETQHVKEHVKPMVSNLEVGVDMDEDIQDKGMYHGVPKDHKKSKLGFGTAEMQSLMRKTNHYACPSISPQ